jgi:hypothetical protein
MLTSPPSATDRRCADPPGVVQPPSGVTAYGYAMAYYIFNVITEDASQATQLLRSRIWAVGALEPHRDGLVAGDLALVYLAAPKRMFIGRTELASAVHDWTDAEAQVYPGSSPSGVSLAVVDEWDPPVPMHAVLSRIDRSAGARADFAVGVVRITEEEYLAALAVAAQPANPTTDLCPT